MEIVGVVVCASRVLKMKEHLLFRKEFNIFCIKIELLLTVLPNFERKLAFKIQLFDG